MYMQYVRDAARARRLAELEAAKAATQALDSASTTADEGKDGKDEGEGNKALDGVTMLDGVTVFDGVLDDVSAIDAAAIVYQWAETDDLEQGEGYADRLLSLCVGALPYDVEDDLTDEQSEELADIVDDVATVLESMGVAEDDLVSLLDDWDNDAGERVQEFVAAAIEDGSDPASFVMGDGSDEAALDAVYKKRVAIRNGKKVKINKRVSGKVILSAGQKVAVRKMLMKSRTSIAKLKRAKSMRVRRKMGL